MKNCRFYLFIGLALAATTSVWSASKKTILSLKESITDESIVYPYSFEINTREMQTNWYLQNYAVVDDKVESKSPEEVSDAEYVQRLRAIPSGVELPFNPVVKSYITRYITKERTMVSQLLGMTPYYMPIFERALEKEGLPHELKYIPIIESALNPNVVSNAGAAGLWQFMVDTGKDLGLEINSLVDERRDPYKSSEAAAAYFKQLYGIYNDWSLAIAAYNCGPANVNKALRRVKNNDKPDYWTIYEYLPKETRGYVPAFIAATYVMHNYQKHNINPALPKKPLIIDTVKVNYRVSFNQISSVLNIPVEEIRILNPQYRHDIIPGDTHPYTLALPSQQIYSYIMVEDSIRAQGGGGNYAVNNVEPSNQNRTVAQVTTSTEKPVTKAKKVEESTYVANNAPKATNDGGDVKYHKVKRGETIESIAEDYNVSVNELMALNNLNRKRVSRGQVLKIGGGQVAESKQPKAEPSYTAKQTTTPAPKKEAAPKVAEKVPAKKENVVAKKESKTAVAPSHKGSYSVNDEISASEKKKTAATEEERTTASKKKVTRYEEEKPRTSRNSKRNAEKETARTSKRNKKNRNYDDDEKTSSKNRKSTKAGKKKTAAKEKANPTSHSVRSGESLERIAHSYGLGTDQLKKANPQLKDPDKLKPGEKLNIPKKSRKAKSSKEKSSSSSSKKSTSKKSSSKKKK